MGSLTSMEVMRLIDLIADLDTPSGSELRAFADRALVQVQTNSLRIGIATEGGRPIGELLALIDGMGVKRDVWSISSIDRPTGVDAWVIVSGEGDAEKGQRFLERIGSVEKVTIDPQQDLAPLKQTVERWQRDRDSIRSAVLRDQAKPALEVLARDQAALEERLRALPDAAEAERARDAFDERSTIALEALNTAAGEVVEELREEVVRCFSDWVSSVTANHGERPSRDRVQESLEKWLRDRFAKSFADRLARRVSTHADNLPELRAALNALVQAQVADFAAPAVNVPEDAEPSAFRWLLPLAAGGVGWWRGGVKLAVVGGAFGMFAARFLRKRARKPLEDRALKAAAANHLASHFDAVIQGMIASLRTECALEGERLKRAVAAAEQSKPEREKIRGAIDQLAKARALLTA